MSEIKKSKVAAEVVVDATPQQVTYMSQFIQQWENSKGLVIGTLAERNGAYMFGFRQVPPELGAEILQIVNDFYANGGQQNETNV
ncbi:MAG TPA: hypothetical protein PKY59_07650 [Pyrinomonadaceae bacterium]|nr:hypothetical protein [Pyrinomonadaceae bacterium]